MKRGFLFIFLFFFLCSPLWAFKIKKVFLLQEGENKYSLSFTLEDLPFQEALLALKRKEKEALLICKVEIYQKRLLLRDEKKEEFVFFKKAGFNPLKNLFYYSDNFQELFYETPEELMKAFFNFEGLPLNIPFKMDSSYYLVLTLELKFFSHLDKNLRYTSKEREYLYKTQKRYDLSKEVLY